MAENAPPVNLNKTWMNNFLTKDVSPFLTALKKIREDGEYLGIIAIPSIPSLQGGEDGAKTALGFHDGQLVPLAIGTMAADAAGRTNGGYLIKAINGLVDELDGILKLQVELFEEIEDNLLTTTEKLFNTQDTNLEKIDGKEFVDFFEGVDEVLSESSGGSGDDD